MSPFDLIAHLPTGSEIEARFRRDIRRSWALAVGFAGAAVILLATVVGEWIVAHPLALACALGPYVVLDALIWWLVPRVGEPMPIELADGPGQPEDLAERVGEVLARAEGRRAAVFLTRNGQ